VRILGTPPEPTLRPLRLLIGEFAPYESGDCFQEVLF
jgi:hypothetical protein